MGLLIGRWENWYKTDKFGTAKLNIDDALVLVKSWQKEKYSDHIDYIYYEEK